MNKSISNITTIKLTRNTKERLSKLREYRRETFNDILNKIFYILNICDKEPERAKKILENIDKRIKKREIMNKSMKIDR